LAVAIAIAMIVGGSAINAFAGTNAVYDYDSYTVTAGSTDTSTTAAAIATQYVEVTFTYPEAVKIVDATALAAHMYVTIAGSPIATLGRPITATADGSDLIFTIGSNPTPPPPTAIQGGILVVTGSALNEYITLGANDSPADIDFATLIPGGATLTAASYDNEGLTNSVSVDIATAPQVRGIVNIGIYTLETDPVTSEQTLVPIADTNSSTLFVNNPGFANGLNAFPAHFPNFQDATPASTASDIAYTLTNGVSPAGMGAIALPTGYTITASGTTLTVTGPVGEVLYLYIVDDLLVKAEGTATFSTVTYDDLVAANGVLSAVPVY
jgi:hypothetical protein